MPFFGKYFITRARRMFRKVAFCRKSLIFPTIPPPTVGAIHESPALYHPPQNRPPVPSVIQIASDESCNLYRPSRFYPKQHIPKPDSSLSFHSVQNDALRPTINYHIFLLHFSKKPLTFYPTRAILYFVERYSHAQNHQQRKTTICYSTYTISYIW